MDYKYFENQSGEIYAWDISDPAQVANMEQTMETGTWTELSGPPPLSPPTAEQNKQRAMTLLQQTDWTELPSVSNPGSGLYLMNAAEFVTYRDAIRQVAVYPTAGDLEWPVIPTEQWSGE